MKISFFIPNLKPGGAENVLITIINQLVLRRPQDQYHLCICDMNATRLGKINSNIKIINFYKSKLRFCLKDLINYLKIESPSFLISSLDYANLLASFAHQLSFVDTKLILWEHSVTSIHSIKTISKYKIVRYLLVNYFYNRATRIICVSKGVSNDLKKKFNIKKNKHIVLYNPINHNNITELSSMSDIGSSSIIKKGEYILSIGRLAEAKNIGLLVKAFNEVKNKIKYKLIIMGEGPERSRIENLISKLNLSNYIYLVGYFSNPYILLKHSKAVISSSNWEGLPLALIESLSLGKYIISTDCPYGPREVLDNGRYGVLVPPNDIKLLSDAIKNISLNKQKIDKKMLTDRAKYFSLDRAINKFDEIFKL